MIMADIRTEQRAFAGNFLYSTGANEVAGRHTLGHYDLPRGRYPALRFPACTAPAAVFAEPVTAQSMMSRFSYCFVQPEGSA